MFYKIIENDTTSQVPYGEGVLMTTQIKGTLTLRFVPDHNPCILKPISTSSPISEEWVGPEL